MTSPPPRRGLHWIIINLSIGLFTVVMSCLSLFSSLFDGRGKLQHGCARIWARFILWISRVQVRVDGLENLPLDRPCILTSNHQSYFDIWTLLAVLPVQFRFAAKEELFRIPFLGWHLKRSGNIPIHRNNPRKALRSLREAGRRIDNGVPVLLFPEGGRSPDGQLQPFKRGVLLLAAYSKAPIVPLVITGSRAVMPKGSFHIRPGDIRLQIAPAIDTSQVGSHNIDGLMEEVRHAISSRLSPAS